MIQMKGIMLMYKGSNTKLENTFSILIYKSI